MAEEKEKLSFELEEEKKEIEASKEYEDKAIKHVHDCKKDSQDFYDEKFRMFNYYDRLYIKGAAKTNVPYGRANLELPLAFQQIEPFVCQMTETMVGEAPYIGYKGRELDDEEVAEEITNFTQYQLDCGRFLSAWLPWIRNLGKYGTAAMKIVWEYDSVEVTDEIESPIMGMNIDPESGQPIEEILGWDKKTETQDFVKHDGPTFYNLSLFDLFVPRSAVDSNIQKMDWVVHRCYRSLEQLLKNPNYSRAHERIKALLEKAEAEGNSDTPLGGSSNIRDTAKRISMDQKNPAQGSKKYQGQVEVLEWWGDYKLSESSERAVPALIVVAVLEDEKILLRFDENPLKFKFKPFLMANDYIVEGEPYGYGELHHIKGLIEESTALRNARLDVANISLNRVWLVERQSGVNLRELYTAPNKIILTNDLNGIKPMDMGNVTPSSVQELARIDFDIQNTTEIINPRQDVSNVGAAFGSTATGVNFLSAKANVRLMTKARLLEETFFAPLAQMLNWYNRDFVTDEMYYRVDSSGNSNPYRTIDPQAFLTTVDYIPTSNPQKLSLAQRKDNMGYLLQTVAQVEGTAGGAGRTNWEELLKEVYKISGFSHPEKYVLPAQTQIMQTPDGQLLDSRGQPVIVQTVDAEGNPVAPEEVPTEGMPEGVSV